MDPEIRHLRAICAIADAGSLSRAAALLGVSQPALTNLLQRIERSVGGQLFARGRRGVQPTALGERAIARARLALSELDGLLGDLTSNARSDSRTIRMGSAHMECVGTMLKRLRDALPDAELTLQVEPSAVTLAQALAQRKLDIALVAMMADRGVALRADLAQRTFIPCLPAFVAMSQQHRLATRDEVELAELASEWWICPPGPDDGSLESLRAACRRVGFEPHIRFQTPDCGARPLIASGKAVQLVEPAAARFGGLITKRLVGDPLGIRLVLAWHRQRLSRQRAGLIYRAAAQAYAEHAVSNPTYAAWWRTHPEAHPPP